MKKTAKIKDGIFYLNEKPVFVTSADYPYYRDDPENWDDRLKKIKAAGIDTVTFYTPWRHHMLKIGGKRVVDFDGRTQANRGVKMFVKLCAKNGLWMVVKPGPFIHAETNFGGLPDWASSEEDAEIEPFDKPRKWGKLLPAPLCGKFKGMVREWYGLVYKNVIKDNIYPKGNVIAVQVCNEGLYSNAPAPVTGYDYSPSSLALYRKFAKDEKAPAPRDFPGVNDKSGLKDCLKWAEWQAEFMRLIYAEYSSPIKSEVPLVVNINPPKEDRGLDHWLTRIIPERWPNVNYGFTNWLKPVSEDRSSFERYSLLSKRKRGINWEENWGFSKLYDNRFQYPVVCVFETLLAVANGATGFNVYTAANTASWDELLDNTHERPYPDSSPIREDGSLTKKYEVLSLMARFFKDNSADFFSAKPDSTVAWGLYPPYAYLAAWDIPRDDWKKLEVEPVKCGYEGLDGFQRILREKNRDFRIVNIESASVKELLRYKNIVLHGGFFMDRKTQDKLSEYISLGGKLVFIGTAPSQDENFKKYDILKKGAACLPRMDGVPGALADTNGKLKVKDPATQVWVYENPKKNVQFFFIFNLSGHSGMREFTYSGKAVKIALPQKSAAAIKVKDSRLRAAFIKGVNEMHETSVTPEVSFGKDRLKAESPCDLLALREGEKWRITIVES